jgi:hypothetical protein
VVENGWRRLKESFLQRRENVDSGQRRNRPSELTQLKRSFKSLKFLCLSLFHALYILLPAKLESGTTAAGK